MTNSMSTAQKILQKLEPYGLKQEGENKYRCNRPWSSGSDSLGLTINIDDPEHGAWYDHVADEGGSLYELAARLGIETNHNGSNQPAASRRTYLNLDEYAAAHGVHADVFRDAGWKEERYPYDGDDHSRPALRFSTKNGDRWRFLDDKKPKYKSSRAYKSCWYGLTRAVATAQKTSQPLVVCNGEASVVSAQYYGVPACAITGGEKNNIPTNLLEEVKEAWSGEIIISPDCDDTGLKMAEGWYSQLSEAGYRVRAVDLNGGRGFDLADFCALHKNNALDQLQKLNPLEFEHVQDSDPAQAQPESEPATNNKDRFQIHWAEEAFESHPPLEFIVDGLITVGSVNLVVGDSGSKKTWALLDLGVSVALGAQWLDRNVQQGPVLFIDEESGPRRLRRRLYLTLRGHFAKPETPLAFVSLAQLDLTNTDDVNALHLLIESTEAKLVIIDAQADVTPGVDENNVKDVQPIYLALKRIAESTQAAIIVIHHTNRAGQYRGSSALKGVVDLMLIVESKKDSPIIKFRDEKVRDIENARFTAYANFVDDAEQFWLSLAEDMPEKKQFGKAQMYVLRYLSEHGPMLLTEIENHADVCTSSAARQAVFGLTNEGYTARVDGGGSGSKATYALTDKGREYVDKM